MKQAQIKLSVNTQAAIKSIGDLNNEINGTIATVSDLKMTVEALQQELESTEIGSERFNELKIALVEANRELKNYELSIEALDHEQVASEIGSVVGGLTDMVGGLTLLGVSNENVEKIAQTFAKVEGAGRAVVGSIEAYQSAQKLLNSFSGVGVKIQQALTSALTFQTTATEGATLATRGLGIAMKALPIVAIVGAITGLVAAFVSYNKSNEEAAKAEKERAEAIKRANQYSKESAQFVAKESTQFVGLIYQLKATNKNSKERSDLIKDINKQYGTTLKNLSDENEFQQQLNVSVKEYIALQFNKFKLQKNEEYFTAQLEKRFKAEQDYNKALQQSLKSYNIKQVGQNQFQRGLDDEILSLGDLRRSYSDLNSSLLDAERRMYDSDEALEKLGLRREELITVQDNLTDGGKKYVEQTRETSKSTEKLTKDTDALTNALIAYYDALESDRQRRITDDREKELQEAANRYDNLTALADKAGEDTKAITEQYQKDIQDINTKYDNLDKQKEQDKLNNIKKTNAEILILAEELAMQEELNVAKTEEEKEKIRKKYASRIANLQIAQIKTERDIALQNTELTEEQRQKIIADSELKIAKLREEATDSSLETAQTKLEKWVDDNAAYIESAISTINQITDLIGQVFDEQNERAAAAREERYNAEVESYNAMLANQTISREQFDIKMRELDQQKRNEELQARRKAFNQSKSLQIVNAVMQTAQAVLAAFSSAAAIPIAGVALGPIMAGVAGALGAAQIAIISSQQFRAARGGVVPGMGPSNVDSVPSMLAPGEAVINSNSAKMFPQLLSAINQAGGGISLAPETAVMQPQTSNNVFQQNDERIIKAYVSETDVTQVQKRISRIERTSSF